MKKKILFLGVLSALVLAGCGQSNNDSKTTKPTPKPSKPSNEVQVIVMSGQSNMQGNTSFGTDGANLTAAFNDLGITDGASCLTGISTVKTSFFEVGYGEINQGNQIHASINEDLPEGGTVNNTIADMMLGKFCNTRAGFGSNRNGSQMGPELGCAYGLKDYGTEEKPIFIIKCAFNGSGFAQGGNATNWNIDDEVNLFKDYLVPFVKNNLTLIENQELKPVIKAWCWHQGESDCEASKIAAYGQRLGKLVDAFRTEFADYAVDEDKDNIAFIDGMVYEGKYSSSPRTSWTTPNLMNAEKQTFADSAENNFLIDLYANEEAIEANELRPGNPGGDSMHYNCKSSFRLGRAYAKILIDNEYIVEPEE